MFRAAVAACNPAARVRMFLPDAPRGRLVYGIAMGKAALAMARGAGPVFHGVCVTDALDGQPLPKGWYVLESSHPIPDARSLAAGDAVCDVIASAREDDVVLALVSGGASALVERPIAGLSLEQYVCEIQAVVASGAPIHAINAARIARSQLKGGKLARLSLAPVFTAIASDVTDDDITIVGSGPTCPPRPEDVAVVVSPMNLFGLAMRDAVASRVTVVDLQPEPFTGAVDDVATALLARFTAEAPAGGREHALVAWGESTVALPPDPGVGGRAQQLALVLARALRRGPNSAFVAGSDGSDGPRYPGVSTPAGAFVDGRTWDAIAAAGLDPDAALAGCDAGTALGEVGALVYTQPTGINHGDIVVIG
jgi:hydroxypyruvate reductase